VRSLQEWDLIERLMAAALTVLLAACAEFPGNKLPAVPIEALARSKVDAADYTLSVHMDGVDDPDDVLIYGIVLETEMSHVFASTHRGRSDARLRLDVAFGCAPMSAAERTWVELSALTVFVVPARRQIVYTLSVRASWDGKPLKSYRYEDSLNRWIGIVFLPFAPTNHPSGKRVLEIARNLDANFLAELSKDLETLPGVTASP
jgi:hypothetical protein